MSLRPQPSIPPVPDDTARVARAAFRRGNPYVLLRDRLGTVFDDTDFADLYPALGQVSMQTPGDDQAATGKTWSSFAGRKPA